MSEALIMMKPFKRVLLAGDHLQLPPVIKSEKARKLGLGKSIMEHLVERIPSRTFMLETQFRSNYHISEWSSNIFYNGRLRPSAANHTRYLGSLTGVDKSKKQILLENGLIWFDTSGFNMKESPAPLYNDGEVKMIENIYNHLIKEIKLKPSQIGIITPHWAQVSAIRSQFKKASKKSENYYL